ncbi:DUF6493 family protein [Peterkaempfera sp. SMS 1(5)a]|uniref:DUF6493 family protein n=1 Tax=Peterkaempfera podocarpi TaxID=3232308 RepID=UPI003672DA86
MSTTDAAAQTAPAPASSPASRSEHPAGGLRSRMAGALARMVPRGTATAPEDAGPVGTPGMRLVAAVREGRADEVLDVLPELDPAARRACLPRLKEIRKELRGEWSDDARRQRVALLLAGMGCNTGAVAAAQWIGSAVRDGLAESDFTAIVRVFAAYDPAWQQTVAQRLAGRRESAWGWGEYPLVEYLLRITGSPVPTSDPWVARWAQDRTWKRLRPDLTGETWQIALPSGATLLERLRADSWLPVLAPRLFETADIGSVLDSPWRRDHADDTWPGALARLAEEGVLDRVDLVDRCLARLLRGGRPGEMRSFLNVLEALAPTPEEQADRVPTYLRLLPDAHSTVAGHAQQVLVALDDAGRIDAEQLAEASRAVLFRSEKKLVRAQLSWLDRAARRDPGQAAAVVLAAADALGHEDTAIQERALNLIARHIRGAGEGVLPELRAAAEGLDHRHQARAAELFGFTPVGPPADEPGELLPPVPVPQPLAPPLATPEEVAEEVAAILATRADLAARADMPAFERALDGLVRHAHRDRPALAAALEPVVVDRDWHDRGHWWSCNPSDIVFVAMAVLDRIPVSHIRHAHLGRASVFGARHTAFGAVMAARLIEAAWQIVDTPPPGLLATPTVATGALDPASLVGRLRAYEDAGATPGEVDFSQALLRLTPPARPGTADAAEALGSAHGRRLAHWLRSGGPAHPRVTRAPRPESGQSAWELRLSARRILLEASEAAAPGPLAPPLAALLRPTGPLGGQGGIDQWSQDTTAHWSAVLPHHREIVAVRCQRRFAAAADQDERGAAGLLPRLAEADGTAGEALHLGVAYGLGARFPEDRAAAIDALLVLAARGDLDGALLGGQLAELVSLGAVKTNRLSAALGDAARTGAQGTVWSVLAALLPGLLTGEPVRGAADLLAVAGDCARRSRARGALSQVSAVAARGGSSRLVKEARLLRDVLGAD